MLIIDNEATRLNWTKNEMVLLCMDTYEQTNEYLQLRRMSGLFLVLSYVPQKVSTQHQVAIHIS
jgi:hypothetical protein